ncbi:MAG: hypothetical protein ABEK10_03005 [Candidatus Nanosalina sp.]
MNLEGIVERAEKMQQSEDNSVLDDEASLIGEGANTSAHVSTRGYVVKPVAYDLKSENPFKRAEIARKADRFPWLQVDEREAEGPFNYALVKMARSNLTHEEAVETAHIQDIINRDLDMFFDLRDDNITYRDFKPDNIGYFWEDESLIAKPIDVIDSNAWEQEEDLLYRRFSDIIDVYIRGTPDEDGLTDFHSISVPEVEEYVLDYLGLETTNITGDPYKDLFQTIDESQESLDDILSY